MSADDQAEDIRQRMVELRRELSCDIHEVGQSARVMTDWTFYVRRFPWATAAVVAAVGYMLVPKKKEIIKPDPDMLAEMVKKKQIRVEPVSRQKQKEGLLKPLLVMGLTWAARTGAGYMGRRLSDAALHKAQESRAPHHEPAPSPLHEPWKI
ncbi:MAG: hypothetical protein WD738_05485 [Pirellulales bacterium]